MLNMHVFFTTKTGRKLVLAFFLISVLSSCSYAHRNPIEKQRLDAWKLLHTDYETYNTMLKKQLTDGKIDDATWNAKVYPVITRAYTALQKANLAGSSNDETTFQSQMAAASAAITEMKTLAGVSP